MECKGVEVSDLSSSGRAHQGLHHVELQREGLVGGRRAVLCLRARLSAGFAAAPFHASRRTFLAFGHPGIGSFERECCGVRASPSAPAMNLSASTSGHAFPASRRSAYGLPGLSAPMELLTYCFAGFVDDASCVPASVVKIFI